MPYDTLSDLHTRTVDTEQGFEKMVETAEPEFRPRAERFLKMHQRHAGILGGMLTGLGEKPDADGSFMGTINQAVVTARSWVDEIDGDVMEQVRSGEKHVLSAFDDAANDPENAAHRAELLSMKGELIDLLDDTPSRR